MKRTKTTREALDKGKEVDKVAQSGSPARKEKSNFPKRKAKVTREHDQSSSPVEDIVAKNKRQNYVPPSPNSVERRMLR
jgi:hypothetical protein